MGRHCRELRLVLRIADLKEDSHTLQDAAATWLLGHTQRITFGTPFVRDAELLVEAAVHVPCAYLQPNRLEALNGRENQQARCTAHGFRGGMPPSAQPPVSERPTLRRPNGAFRVFLKGRQRTLPLRLKGAARHALPVLNGNPCATAPCRTADNTRGAACCRDLTLDVMIPKSNTRLEALLRARKSPYLCKVDREDDRSIECEVISACSYLDPADDVSCVLHDRLLPNGRLAKPSICREWPELDEDEVAHPGCVVADDGKQ
jgi:hypothetical protein